MNLLKMGLLFKHHCTIKVKKTCPYSHWIREKGRHLIKIEDTHQEEEYPQETMATSMEDPTAQKILKALEEHGEALKKMGGRITRLEESKLKKPPHVDP